MYYVVHILHSDTHMGMSHTHYLSYGGVVRTGPMGLHWAATHDAALSGTVTLSFRAASEGPRIDASQREPWISLSYGSSLPSALPTCVVSGSACGAGALGASPALGVPLYLPAPAVPRHTLSESGDRRRFCRRAGCPPRPLSPRLSLGRRSGRNATHDSVVDFLFIAGPVRHAALCRGGP